MGQTGSKDGPADAAVEAAAPGQVLAADQSMGKPQGRGPGVWKKHGGRSSARSSIASRSSCGSASDPKQQQHSMDDSACMAMSSTGGALSNCSQLERCDSSSGLTAPGTAPSPAAAAPAGPQQQQQQQPPYSLLPPRPPTHPAALHTSNSLGGSSHGSSSSLARLGARRSSSMEQGSPMYAGSNDSQQQQQQMPPRPRSLSGRGSTHSSSGAVKYQGLQEVAAVTLAGKQGSVASMGSGSVDGGGSRASFSRDAELEPEHSPGSFTGVQQQQQYGKASIKDGAGKASCQSLHQQNVQTQNLQQQQQRRSRSSVDSCTSKVSSGAARSTRSSFAAEADDPDEPDVAELDHYGRPSFAAFEPVAKAGRGAVFEASLPPDLADMYRRLAVLLPQAPLPLVTVLQLWGITDPQEAQETVQIFVMQGVLKVATLPDGATWLMVSPDHQQYILADHPESVRDWHQAVLDIYKRQVIATRYIAAQQAGGGGGSKGYDLDEVAPSQFLNDGYIWLALTHHLLGAGQLTQVRQLLIDPAWLEVKLHCYGVAAVVDDFRHYLQVGNDLTVKAVLQAFQMSLSCCMERSHLPMMRHQLVLRLMAAATAAAAAAAAAADAEAAAGAGGTGGTGYGARGSFGARTGHSSAESGAGSSTLLHQQQDYQQEMRGWFGEQYAKCRSNARLLQAGAGQASEDQQQLLPPHLMGYTPSLRQAGGMHRMALRGHLGPIRQVVITPDGKDVLTASDDGGVQVWDMDIGDCVMQLQLTDQPGPSTSSPTSNQGSGTGGGAPVPLTSLAVTADGCCLCGDAEGWLTCWNLKTGQLVQRVRAHRGRLNALALDSSGSRCITAGQDRTARLWSLPTATPGVNRSMSLTGAGVTPVGTPGYTAAGTGGTGSAAGGSLMGSLQLEFEMTGHGLEHSDTGDVLDVALSSDGVLGASVSDDGKVKVWDLDQQQCVHTCRGHTGWVVSVRFIGNTHTLVTASHDGTARVWDAWTGECLGSLIGHSGRLNAVRCSSDGRTIVTCSDDQTARVWETIDYTCIGVMEGHTGWINDVALLRSGSQAVTISGDGTARLWDTRNGKCLQVLQGHSDDVTCVVLTSRGRFVVTGSVDGTAQVWDLAAQNVSSLDNHQGKVISVVCCPDGSHAASIGADGCLRLWDLATGACLGNQAGHVAAIPQCLLLVADGSRAFSGAGDRKLVAWDMKSGSPSFCLPAQQGSRTKCIHVSGDGSIAVALLFDSSMAVYDTATGALRCHLMQRGDRDAQRVHSGGVNGVYLTRDGGRAVSVSKDTTARVWDTASGMCTLVLQGHGDSVHAAAISPDECLLASASFDCTVRLWDLTTGDCLKVLQHTDPVMHVAFSPPCVATQASGRLQGGDCVGGGLGGLAGAAGVGSVRLVTGCDGRALWLWDVESGACVAALGEHKEAVTAVAFSPDGVWLASSSQDRSVLVWEAASGRLVGIYVGDAAMTCCCFEFRGPEGVQQQPGGSTVGPDKALQPDEGSAAADTEAVGGAGSGAGGDGAQVTAAAAGGSSSSCTADGVAGAAAKAAGVVPLPGGLVLVVGDASGHVHFIDCL